MQEVMRNLDLLRKGAGFASIGVRVSPEISTRCLNIIEQFPEHPFDMARRMFQFMASNGITPSAEFGAKARAEVNSLRDQYAERYGRSLSDSRVAEHDEIIRHLENPRP